MFGLHKLQQLQGRVKPHPVTKEKKYRSIINNHLNRDQLSESEEESSSSIDSIEDSDMMSSDAKQTESRQVDGKTSQ